MHFLPDENLYSSSEACLRFLRALPERFEEEMENGADLIPVHFFWQGTFTAKPALCLKSFFVTQDLGRFRCWVWLENREAFIGAQANPHLAPFLPFIELRFFSLADVAAGTPLAEQRGLFNRATAAQISDVARLVVLYRHGGIYSDLDALFLRDLRSLLRLTKGEEFGFQWSYLRRGTNAFCFHRPASPVLLDLMIATQRHRSAHASSLFDFDRDQHNFLILPAAFFSPLWLHDDGKECSASAPFDHFKDFFRPFHWWFHGRHPVTSYLNFFPGAFTYHWHGLWRSPETHGSFAGIVARSFEVELAAKFPSLTGLPAYGGGR